MIQPYPEHHKAPQEGYTLRGLLAFVIAPFALIALLSQPLLVATVVGSTLFAAIAVQKLLQTYVKRMKDSPRTLRIPGVGQVTYRVTPR